MSAKETVQFTLQSNEGRGLFLCRLQPGTLKSFLNLCNVRSIPEITDLHMRGLCFKALEFTRKHLEFSDPIERTTEERQEFCDRYDTQKSYVDFVLTMTVGKHQDWPQEEVTLLHKTLEPRGMDFSGMTEEG